MIKINNLQYSYFKKRVLNGITLEIPENHFMALAGLNGAGKTTLFKLVLDLLRTPERNNILIGGLSSWELGSRKTLLYLPEKFRLNAQVSAMNYFKFLSGIYRQELNIDKVYQLCRTLNFPEKRLTDASRTYSKGMLQKVGLMGCFVLDYKFILLDEPLSGLDPKARLHTKELMLEVKSELNKTLLFSTHMLSDVDEICDIFSVLHDGDVRFQGSPSDCKSLYQSRTLENAFIRCIENVATN